MFLPLAAQALYRSLEELAVCGQIPLELLPAIIHQYDLVLFTALSERGGGGVAGGRGRGGHGHPGHSGNSSSRNSSDVNLHNLSICIIIHCPHDFI